jgi:hypothetical protein
MKTKSVNTDGHGKRQIHLAFVPKFRGSRTRSTAERSFTLLFSVASAFTLLNEKGRPRAAF